MDIVVRFDDAFETDEVEIAREIENGPWCACSSSSSIPGKW
jgi:hypothetical protein